jgi:hypothetical protein
LQQKKKGLNQNNESKDSKAESRASGRNMITLDNHKMKLTLKGNLILF